jgi:hypothetical protein
VLGVVFVLASADHDNKYSKSSGLKNEKNYHMFVLQNEIQALKKPMRPANHPGSDEVARSLSPQLQ